MSEPKLGPNRGNAGKGRPKGAQNKVTREFKQTVQMLLESNKDNVARWLTLVAEGDGTDSPAGRPNPAKALELLSSLAEFAQPKLARTEHTGEGGGPVEQNLTVTFK